MNAAIAGIGWITPLGADLDVLRTGAVAETKPIPNPESGQALLARPVPPKLVEHLARNPRLRRSSPISYFGVAAAQAALAEAGPPVARTALVFAVSDGGVIYTRRFYDQIVRQGANAASPLLFPETVYNAPASHLAAVLGIDEASYTLVGDQSVGLAALHFGAQLLALGQCDRVVVVGCEEIDWILCEAFHDWRLASTPLAEGAGAIVLEREGPLRLATVPGVPFARRSQAPEALCETVGSWNATAIVSSANGTFADKAERSAFAGEHTWVFPKKQLGEAPGASALWQVVHATHLVRSGTLQDALVSVVGFNQQAVAALVTQQR
jgi:Beta-ketoacyl synthase, N-terminal domain